MTFDADEHKANVLAREADEKPYRIREWKPTDDVAFVGNAWRESYYVGGPGVQRADRHDFKAEMQRMFARLLPAARILVACDREDEDTLLGFAAAHGSTLLYVYVRGGDEVVNVRKQGVARDLVESLGKIDAYMFRTVAGEHRLRPRERGWKFTPRHTL